MGLRVCYTQERGGMYKMEGKVRVSGKKGDCPTIQSHPDSNSFTLKGHFIH